MAGMRGDWVSPPNHLPSSAGSFGVCVTFDLGARIIVTMVHSGHTSRIRFLTPGAQKSSKETAAKSSKETANAFGFGGRLKN
jgi:hypothetical protein